MIETIQIDNINMITQEISEYVKISEKSFLGILILMKKPRHRFNFNKQRKFMRILFIH